MQLAWPLTFNQGRKGSSLYIVGVTAGCMPLTAGAGSILSSLNRFTISKSTSHVCLSQLSLCTPSNPFSRASTRAYSKAYPLLSHPSTTIWLLGRLGYIRADTLVRRPFCEFQRVFSMTCELISDRWYHSPQGYTDGSGVGAAFLHRLIVSRTYLRGYPTAP